jgi:hypothetical protein
VAIETIEAATARPRKSVDERAVIDPCEALAAIRAR